VNVAVTILVALVSGTGGWGILQFVLTRTGRKAEIARKHAETERLQIESAKAREDTEANNRKILAAAQIAAQQAALESSDRRYAELKSDYEHTRIRMGDLRSATEELVEVIEQLIYSAGVPTKTASVYITVTWTVYREARSAIKRARDHLW
jgi:uncharacterized protein HemX